MKRLTAVLVVLILSSLASSSCAKPSPVPDSGSSATARLQSPITVTWEQLELSASKVRLMAHIKRVGPMNVPLAVRIELPPGARMTIGKTSFELSPNAAADEVFEPVELAYGQLPMHDLVLHVTGGGAGGGVSYAVPYRFGRTAPEQVAPKAHGPSQIINGRDMGKAISLDPKQE